MSDPRRPELDMLPDGSFRQPVRPPILTRIFIWAVAIAAIAGALALAAFAFWLVLILIPIALIAGLVAWASLRFQLWRARRSGPGGRPLWRP